MTNSNHNLQRSILPIPDQKHVGLTTFQAADPDTSYPPVHSACNGRVKWVQIDVDEAAQDPDHTVSPEEQF
jgi:hypothetical protein